MTLIVSLILVVVAAAIMVAAGVLTVHYFRQEVKEAKHKHEEAKLKALIIDIQKANKQLAEEIELRKKANRSYHNKLKSLASALSKAFWGIEINRAQLTFNGCHKGQTE